jgi:hypothetical protein
MLERAKEKKRSVPKGVERCPKKERKKRCF